MKRKYEMPDMEIIEIFADDMVVTSTGLNDGGSDGKGGSSDWPF